MLLRLSPENILSGDFAPVNGSILCCAVPKKSSHASTAFSAFIVVEAFFSIVITLVLELGTLPFLLILAVGTAFWEARIREAALAAETTALTEEITETTEAITPMALRVTASRLVQLGSLVKASMLWERP